MQYRLLHEDGGQRTFAVILQTGDEAMSCLQTFAEKEGIAAAQLTAIGAFREARLAYFDWDTKSYQPIPVAEQVEVASLVGTSRRRTGSRASTRMPFSAGATERLWPDTCRMVTCDRRSR